MSAPEAAAPRAARWWGRALQVTACVALMALATGWAAGFQPARAPRLRGIHPQAVVIDGVQAHWARSYAKVEFAAGAWRPLRLRIRLRAPADTPAPGLAVRVAIDEVQVRTVFVTGDWRDYEFVTSRPASASGVVGLQLTTDTASDDPQLRGPAIGPATLTPVRLSAAGAAWAGVGALLGLLVFLGSLWRERAAARWHAALDVLDARPALRLAAGTGLTVGATLAPWAWSWHPTGAASAAWLAIACLVHLLAGRVIRRGLEHAARGPAPAVLRSPLSDLLVGLLAATLALYAWSFALKRLGPLSTAVSALMVGAQQALGGPAVLSRGWFIGLWLGGVALGAVALSRRERRAGLDVETEPALPRVREFAPLAGLLFVVVLAAGFHLVHLYGYSTDPDQHIAWAGEVALQGVVPDTYAATPWHISYPLGMHAVAVALWGFTPRPIATAVNVLPVVASVLFVFLVLGLARDAWSSGGRVLTRGAAPVEALLWSGLALAFSSAQFSYWQRYEGTPRLCAGLLHVVPLMAIGALLAPPNRLDSSEHARRRRAGWGTAALLAALAGSTALLATLNPTHLPLHAWLCAVAVAIGVWRGPLRRSPAQGWIGGLAAASAIAIVVVVADPFWSMRVAGVGEPAAGSGTGSSTPPPLAATSCTNASCLAAALARGATWQEALTPVAVATAGAVEAAVRRPASTVEAMESTRWRFPDLTALAFAPVHGLAPVVLPPALLIFVCASVVRARRLGAMVAGLVLVAVADALVRAVLHATIDPADGALRLLGHYPDRAAAVFFAQSVWPPVLAVTAWAVSGLGVDRWRRAALETCVAAVSLAIATSALVDVRQAVVDVTRTSPGPQPADLSALARLEADSVPPGEAYLVAAGVQELGGERWLLPQDLAATIYLQAARPTLFLYFLDHSARYGVDAYEAVCRALHRGERYPGAIRDTRARWAIVVTEDGQPPDQDIGQRRLCGRPFPAWFPDMRQQARQGRLVLYRLW